MTTIKIDKDEEERRMKMLLRDDFIDDDITSEGVYVPVQLPMIDTGKLFKEEMEKEEKEKQDDGEVKTTKKNSDDDEDEEDKDEVKVEKEKKKMDEGAEVTFLDLVSKSKSGEMMFFQMPDHLPKLKSTKIKTEEQKTNQTNEVVKSSEELKKTRCSITDLPEGYLGNLIVRKSGRTQLRIGDDFFDVELGTQVGFLQDLVSVATPQREDNQEVSGGQVGQMTVLGRVRHRAVVTPDWDNLFDIEDQARFQGDDDS